MTKTGTVAVTGGTGFIGQMLVQNLLDAGFNVRLLTRQSVLPHTYVSQAVEVCQGDLRNPLDLKFFLSDAETVYHLAGEIRDPNLLTLTNVDGTKNLLTACRSSQVKRFLYMSSVGVIGAKGNATQVDETTVAKPGNAYEISKFTAEKICFESNTPNFQVAVVRPSIVYGEGEKKGKDSFQTLLNLIKTRRLILLGQHYLSSYVYAGDVVNASRMIAEHPQSATQVFIINDPVPLIDFANSIADILQVPRPLVLPQPLGGILVGLLRHTGRFASLYNSTTFSIKKICDWGYRFSYGYHTGLHRTIAWYAKNGLL